MSDNKITDIQIMLKKSLENRIYFFNKIESPKFLKLLEDMGYFNVPYETDKFGSSIVWPQIQYLNTLSDRIKLGEVKEKEYLERYVNIIRKFQSPQKNLLISSVLVKINFSIPVHLITSQDIDRVLGIVDECKDSERYLTEAALIEGVADLVARLDLDSPQELDLAKGLYNKIFSICSSDDGVFMSKYSFKHLKQYPYSEVDKKILNVDQLYERNIKYLFFLKELFEAKLTKIVEGEPGLKSCSWNLIAAIPKHHQNIGMRGIYISIIGKLFEIGEILVLQDEYNEVIAKWSQSPLDLFQRLYLSILNHKSTLTKKELEFGADIICKYKLTGVAPYERFVFLEKNFTNLGEESRKGVLETIGLISDNEGGDRTIAWKKMRWAQAFKNSTDAESRALYKSLLKKTDGKEHPNPGFYSYVEEWVGPCSPRSLQEFNTHSIEENIIFLIGFKSDGWKGPDEEGLSRVLEQYVQQGSIQNQEALVEKLSVFSNYMYVSSIVDGLSKSWQENKVLDVKKCLKRIDEYISRDQFREDILDTESRAHWLVSSIASFIASGQQTDDNGFSPDLYDLCYDLLEKLLEITLEDPSYQEKDSFIRAVNEPRGKIFETFIFLVLRKCRLQNNKELSYKKDWKKFEKLIEGILGQEKREPSIRALIGSYYRQFKFMGDDWVTREVDLIAPVDDQEKWRPFLEGFLRINIFLEDPYKILLEKEFLRKFLKIKRSERGESIDDLHKKVISLGIVAYFYEIDVDIVEEALRGQIADEWSYVQFFLYRTLSNDKESEKFEQSCLGILDRMYNLSMSEKENLSSKHFQNLSLLLKCFKNPLSENVKKIFNILGLYSDGLWAVFDAIEYLNSYIEKHPKEIGEIFKDFISAVDSPPAWPQKEIENICRVLKKEGQEETLIEICKVYQKLPDNGPVRDFCS